MIKPWRLVLGLVAPLALANCSPFPAPPHPPTKEPSTAELPPVASLEPRFQEVPIAMPSPSAPPVATPAPTPTPLTVPDWLSGDLIAYEAPPRTDAIQRDLYVYNARLNQIVPMPGANTEADEARPRLSGDRRWMVYQRTAADANQRLRYAAMLFDPIAQQAFPLGTDQGAVDTRAPAISRDGRYVVYVKDGAELDQLVLYDLKTGKDYPLSTARSPFVLIDSPAFSSDGKRVAFSAAARLQNGSADTRDLYFYDLATAMVYTLPFANSRGNEDNPVLSSDGKRVLFESDRNGTRDLFQANLSTGKLDTFSQLNSGRSDETWPAYYGVDDAWIRFKLYPSPQTEPNRFLLQLYNPATTVTNTVPTTP